MMFATKREKVWSKTSAEKSKENIKRCVLCGCFFFSHSRRRKFCCPHHRVVWGEYQYLLRKKKANKLLEWEQGLLERLECFIEKERAKNESLLSTTQQAQGGEM